MNLRLFPKCFPLLSASSNVRVFYYHTNSLDHFNNLPFQEAMKRERKLLSDSVVFKQAEMVSEPQKTNKQVLPGTSLVFACCLALNVGL